MDAQQSQQIPRTWDDEEIARHERLHAAPYLTPDPQDQIDSMSIEEQELAGAKGMAAGLSAADKAAPACYAAGGTAPLSRFRRGPAAGCDALVRAKVREVHAATGGLADRCRDIEGPTATSRFSGLRWRYPLVATCQHDGIS